MKSFKRTMVGEYSRELSNKVFIGQCRLIELGFRQGGTAGYGLRRALVDQQGNLKTLLKMGEHKSFQMDRVVQLAALKKKLKSSIRFMNGLFNTTYLNLKLPKN